MNNRNYRNIDITQSPGYFGEGSSAMVISGERNSATNPDVIEVEAGEKIYAGNAVYVKDNKAFNQTPNIMPNIDYFNTFGIALNDTEPSQNEAETNMVTVQFKGLVDYSNIFDNFEGFTGSQLVVVDNITKNISDITSEAAFNEYDKVIILGNIILENTLNINIQEFINN